jgi:hypothetical protein
MASSLTCVTSENKDEYLIELEYTCNRKSEYHNMSCEKSDCPLSYAIVLAITDFLENHSVKTPIVFYVSDLFAFNLLTDYIKRWKQSNWVNSVGRPVNYVDILSRFYDVVSENNIGYNVLLKK